jgi:hypothetical protein
LHQTAVAFLTVSNSFLEQKNAPWMNFWVTWWPSTTQAGSGGKLSSLNALFRGTLLRPCIVLSLLEVLGREQILVPLIGCREQAGSCPRGTFCSGGDGVEEVRNRRGNGCNGCNHRLLCCSVAAGSLAALASVLGKVRFTSCSVEAGIFAFLR